MMTLRALVEKTLDADILRDMIGFAGERLMELEVSALIGAAYGEKAQEHVLDGLDPSASSIKLLAVIIN